MPRVVILKGRGVMPVDLPASEAKAPDAAVAAVHRAGKGLDISAGEMDAHLARFSTRYVASVAPRAVARHLLMLRRPLASGELRSRVAPAPTADNGQRELDVVAHDTPGLFSEVTGVVSLVGGQVTSAHAHVTRDGIAVDTFEVGAPSGVSTSWWARVEGELVDAVAGRIALRAAVDEAAVEAGSSTTREVALEVFPAQPWSAVHSQTCAGGAPENVNAWRASATSNHVSAIRIRTGDRLGLLFAITDALAELRLDIVSAKVDTRGDMVDDVFVVRSSDRSALDDEQVRQVRRGVSWAVRRLGVFLG